MFCSFYVLHKTFLCLWKVYHESPILFPLHKRMETHDYNIRIIGILGSLLLSRIWYYLISINITNVSFLVRHILSNLNRTLFRLHTKFASLFALRHNGLFSWTGEESCQYNIIKQYLLFDHNLVVKLTLLANYRIPLYFYFYHFTEGLLLVSITLFLVVVVTDN